MEEYRKVMFYLLLAERTNTEYSLFISFELCHGFSPIIKGQTLSSWMWKILNNVTQEHCVDALNLLRTVYVLFIMY